MGNYTIFLKFENPRRGRQARIFSENDPKILDLKSSSEQIIFRKLSLGAPVMITSLVIKKHNLKEKRELFRAVYANFAGCSGQLFLIFSCKFPLIVIVRL